MSAEESKTGTRAEAGSDGRGRTRLVARSAVAGIERGLSGLGRTLYRSLPPLEKAKLYRHSHRPRGQDYIRHLFDDVFVLHGDRVYGEDEAMLTVLATIEGRRCVVLAHRKGRGLKRQAVHAFGPLHPEAFRKARRAMALAEKFRLPVVSFVDTPGSRTDVEAERRGQAHAIAASLAALSALPVPVVVVAIGEGGNPAALAIGFGDIVLVLENALHVAYEPAPYPLAVLRIASKTPGASHSCFTAEDLIALDLADEVLPEPPGGAHTDPEAVYARVRDAIVQALDEFGAEPGEALRARRYARLRSTGVFVDSESTETNDPVARAGEEMGRWQTSRG